MATPNTTKRPLMTGIYAAVPAFFFPGTENLDIPTFEENVARVAKTNMPLAISGTMGEAIHLSHTERVELIKAGRRALDKAGYPHFPIIVGTGAGSTRETVELCKEAAKAGADYAQVIVSGYYAGVLTRTALKDFYVEVANKSPIPVLIYSFPAVSGGIDMDSDFIIDLAIECPNIVGTKLSCNNVGKLTRIALTTADPAFPCHHPFRVFGGAVDYLLPSTSVGGAGAVSSIANIAPHAIAKLQEVAEALQHNPSLLAEAQRLQRIIARAEYTISRTSIPGIKFVMETLYGYGGLPRRHLIGLDTAAAQALWEHPDTQALIKLEQEIGGLQKWNGLEKALASASTLVAGDSARDFLHLRGTPVF